jgi:hypothetical protein
MQSGRRAQAIPGNGDGSGAVRVACKAAGRTTHGGETTASRSRRLGARGRLHAAPMFSSPSDEAPRRPLGDRKAAVRGGRLGLAAAEALGFGRREAAQHGA